MEQEKNGLFPEMLCLYGLENHEFLKNETFFLDWAEKVFPCLFGGEVGSYTGKIKLIEKTLAFGYVGLATTCSLRNF
ncbi:hypothetical protein [Bacillus toyonensis]|uniref:hypothetical protein n=1 Tax=Bacillus toyonensis TaxID=155322 RepID=UPI001C3F2228|nr:hypothetical protein [Bacillus toyonensis]